jgi:predicted unusual protein kinase regulating ubiquinone biosynthesis (AarF/ABC1/UbiB family)
VQLNLTLPTSAQADLHPGNMIVRLEVCDGLLLHKLIMCDAGLVGAMNATATANFIELFHAVLRGDGRTAGLLMVDNAPRQECIDKEGNGCFVEQFKTRLFVFPFSFCKWRRAHC